MNQKTKQKQMSRVALMHGGLSLSRAVADTRLSDEFLRAAKKLGELALADDEA